MGRRIRLQMQRILKSTEEYNPKEYPCTLVSYDEKEEILHLRLLQGALTEISLDAIYRCVIEEANKSLLAEGRILERCRNEAGCMLQMRIENGFYKNNIKLVDKIQV